MTSTTSTSTISTYPESVTLPKVGDAYDLPGFMEAPDGSVYVVVEAGVKAWHGTMRPTFKIVTLDVKGDEVGRTYTDPWRPSRKPLTKGAMDTFALWPENTIATHAGAKRTIKSLTKAQQVTRAAILEALAEAAAPADEVPAE